RLPARPRTARFFSFDPSRFRTPEFSGYCCVQHARSSNPSQRRGPVAYGLLKTDPEEFSWDDQVKRGAKGEPWTGVRNFTARRHLKEIKKGDRFFFYHTGDEKQVVGIGEVTREAFPDPTAGENEPWAAVTNLARKPLPTG